MMTVVIRGTIVILILYMKTNEPMKQMKSDWGQCLALSLDSEMCLPSISFSVYSLIIWISFTSPVDARVLETCVLNLYMIVRGGSANQINLIKTLALKTMWLWQKSRMPHSLLQKVHISTSKSDNRGQFN